MLICLQSTAQAETVQVKTQGLIAEKATEKATKTVEATPSVPKSKDNKKSLKNNRNNIHSTMLGMSVTGNSESPRMLTIVPWRSAEKQSQSANISPVWQPHLGLLDPDSYGREVRQFLDNKNNSHEKNAN